jgi:hypothetical protein
MRKIDAMSRWTTFSCSPTRAVVEFAGEWWVGGKWMATASDVLASLALGGMIGVVGQATRAIVGLKKTAAESEFAFSEFDAARFFISCLLAFIIGIVGVLLLGLDSFATVDVKSILMLAAFGYVGTDLIEGLLGFGRTKRCAKAKPSGENAASVCTPAKSSSGSANLSTDAKIAFDLPDASIAGAPGWSLPKKTEDVESCVSQWLQDVKKVSSADSRNLNKNISDFHISTNNEMEQFIWGVAQCLAGKKYTYAPDPPKDSPDWNLHVAKLLNGTLSALIDEFVSNI